MYFFVYNIQISQCVFMLYLIPRCVSVSDDLDMDIIKKMFDTKFYFLFLCIPVWMLFCGVVPITFL